MTEVIIDCDSHDGDGVVIVCAPTGIMCTAQVGGNACSHPYVEGFPMDVHCVEGFQNALDEFDDCSWGCWVSGGLHYDNSEPDSEEDLNNYGKAVDEFLAENVNNKHSRLSFFEFDYDRIKELTEGWWPVLIRFHNNEFKKPATGDNLYETKFKGYLHFGNCD
jgi:hypothetical protein